MDEDLKKIFFGGRHIGMTPIIGLQKMTWIDIPEIQDDPEIVKFNSSVEEYNTTVDKIVREGNFFTSNSPDEKRCSFCKKDSKKGSG